MKFRHILLSAVPLVTPLHADLPNLKIEIGQARNDSGFKVGEILPPARNDAASAAKFAVIAGKVDENSGGLAALNDGKVPTSNDDPKTNFFFAQDEKGGRITIDLGKPVPVSEVATYSWHRGGRSGQRYTLFAAKGSAPDFDPAPAAGVDPTTKGWTTVGSVDTSKSRPGQHAAKLFMPEGKPIGTVQHLLFDVSATESPRGPGNTFFSEIDVITEDGPELERHTPPVKTLTTFETEGGEFKIILDSTASPDLLPWFKEKAIPAMQEWYPKVAEMIAIPGKTPAAPKSFTIELREGQIIPGRDGIPGFASGEDIVVSSKFMRDQMEGEALGCLIHEMVHIVQFGSGKRADRSTPVWFFEGVTDYIRWYLFEPEKNGTTIREPDKVNYDNSYRVTANFIDWVIKTYSKDLLAQASIAIHDGYSTELWEKWTGKPVEELEKEWKAELRKRLEKN